MNEKPSAEVKKKRILPIKPFLPASRNSERDRLAWALSRGWVKPVDSRRLTVYVIESRKGLPMRIRIRDWMLMAIAWLGWALLLFDAATNNPAESGQLIGPGYWSHGMAQELLFSLILVTSLVLILTLFGAQSLYHFRNPKKKIPKPLPLNPEEQASCCGIDVKTLTEWRMARSLSVEINDDGKLESYESYPKEVFEDVLL